MTKTIGIVDLFSGPGGLAEGFASYKDNEGNAPFQINISIEKEPSAHSTLLLRTFIRKFNGLFPDEYYRFLNGELAAEPDWKKLYPEQWAEAVDEARCMELGNPETTQFLDRRLEEIRSTYGRNTMVIGGPPCQAYSLVGRARNAGILDYAADQDHRHFLYKEYVAVLQKLEPAVFVMENVKGMLSSAVKGDRLFLQVMEDLKAAAGENSYALYALSPRSSGFAKSKVLKPSDFIVYSENHGIPQTRHRVIIVGLRKDIADKFISEIPFAMKALEKKTTVHEVIGGVPKLRSGLSKKEDNDSAWLLAVKDAVSKVKSVISLYPAEGYEKIYSLLNSCEKTLTPENIFPRKGKKSAGYMLNSCPKSLADWLADEKVAVLPNHETRSHMESDLARYMFVSLFGKAFGRSPKASEFPEELAPNHKNWSTGKFADRFRVQIEDQPSTTITSHISKDGHYFIHYDPVQCRSLTVREAARLQTFPDNYYFKGNRTQQYVQVGNAVPPYLAKQIAEVLWPVLKKYAD